MVKKAVEIPQECIDTLIDSVTEAKREFLVHRQEVLIFFVHSVSYQTTDQTEAALQEATITKWVQDPKNIDEIERISDRWLKKLKKLQDRAPTTSIVEIEDLEELEKLEGFEWLKIGTDWRQTISGMFSAEPKNTGVVSGRKHKTAKRTVGIPRENIEALIIALSEVKREYFTHRAEAMSHFIRSASDQTAGQQTAIIKWIENPKNANEIARISNDRISKMDDQISKEILAETKHLATGADWWQKMRGTFDAD